MLVILLDIHIPFSHMLPASGLRYLYKIKFCSVLLEKCWMFHMNLFQHLFNSGEKYTFIDNQQPEQIDFREPREIRICLYKLDVL